HCLPLVVDGEPGACRGKDHSSRPAGGPIDAVRTARRRARCRSRRRHAAGRRAGHGSGGLRALLRAARIAILAPVPLVTRRAVQGEMMAQGSGSPLRVGVGGPVGSGKTTLVEVLCKRMRDRYHLAVVTNDIYTKEDERLLVAAQALAPERIMGVETG